MAVLLAHGADSHQALEKGTSALHEICTRHGLVTPIIAAGHDLERRDAQGQTPLLRACEQRGKSKNAGLHEDDREHTALALIRAGANIHVADNPGSTALHYAVLNNLREVVEELLARGASTVAHNTHGLSPLHVALAESIDRSVDEDAMPSLRFKWNLERLGAAGANATERFPDGRTAPHFIAPVLMQCTAKDIEERAISTGSDEKDEGLYPACLALYQLFLDKGCSREARDNQGNTPIFAYVNQLRVYHMDEYTASPPEESDLRRMFAEHEVHAVNGNGDTLLHVVARRKDDPIDVPYDDEGNLFALLVELGLDPTRENKDGVTAREVAAACDKWSILDSTRNG
ncbi:ankyrin repeat domain-containing protein [Aspergillus fijiensis CBS 313.89]|uniref:Ankyrin n=1 Tax=Aspergillus fijiensis CBS 313.89 TaxID=1448319 RepID=A0A8G1RV11_9EURO|nr:ankyrin [Aspergillus fijiensis CBS 313.89]RAK79438.1 ankyrin [Aspergillus fijiensis CBS 313.89]